MAPEGNFRARMAMGLALLSAVTAVVAVCMVGAVVSHTTTRNVLLTDDGLRARFVAVHSMHPLVLTQRLAERPWNIDAELQGDCRCERPFDKVTRVVKEEIVCHCPRNFVSNPPPFPDNPPLDTEAEYDDGCKCVVDDEEKGVFFGETTCTCPILKVDDWDMDMNPPGWVPPVPGEEA